MVDQTVQSRKDAAKAILLDVCPRGTTIYNVLESVSRSGMSRVIKSYTFDAVGHHWLSGYIGAVLDLSRPKMSDGLKVNGAGMDMGFDLVYRLSYALHGDGYALTARWL